MHGFMQFQYGAHFPALLPRNDSVRRREIRADDCNPQLFEVLTMTPIYVGIPDVEQPHGYAALSALLTVALLKGNRSRPATNGGLRSPKQMGGTTGVVLPAKIVREVIPSQPSSWILHEQGGIHHKC
jgi:hypothetical protein